MSTGAMIHPPSAPELMPGLAPGPIASGQEHVGPGREGLTSADFRRKFTIDDLVKLYDLGFLGDDDRYELIDGDLIEMARVRATHSSAIVRLVGDIPGRLGERASYLVQTPLFLGDESQPQPDFALVEHRPDGYQVAHPRPGETFLVIEVMDTTHRFDRGVKLPRYAAAGIPETWLVDLPGRRIEAHRRPAEGVYLDRFIFLPGDTISPEAFPDLVLAVAQILGVPASETQS